MTATHTSVLPLTHFRATITLAAIGALALALCATQAQAVITQPIPADVSAAPPPIPSLPAAGDTAPPADAISDPIEPAAVCGDWYRQSSYGGTWPAGGAWWEFSCTRLYPICSGACNADWVPSVWIDYFYWDGSQPVFYGQFYGEYYWLAWMSEFCEWWWDQPTGQWYGFERPCDGSEPAPNAVPVARFEYSRDAAGCRFDGSDSTDADGSIADYSWTFGDGTGAVGITAEHAYAAPGTYAATLTVTDERGVSAGLSRPVTIEPPNAAPAPHLAVSCTGGSCMLDGVTSFDPDGTIVGYQWQFGDGTAATDRTAQHTYPAADSYTVTLTVTDDDGATATATQTIGLITLTANGHKFRGVQQVVLSWTGASGASFDVFRDGRQIATVTGNANTDNLNRTGSGRYRYKVCESAGSICSNAASVSF